MVAKVDNIDATGFVLKTTYDTDLETKVSDADKKIPDTSELPKKKTDLTAKITEIEGKMEGILV